MRTFEKNIFIYLSITLILLSFMFLLKKFSNGIYYKKVDDLTLSKGLNLWSTPLSDFGLTFEETSEIGQLLDTIFMKHKNSEMMLASRKDSIEQIVSHIDSLFKSPSKRSETPIKKHIWQFYKDYLENKSQVNCVHYSLLYHIIATHAKIPTRLVSINDNGFHHIFTESYLKEFESWVIIDILNGQVLPKTSLDSTPISAVSLFLNFSKIENNELSTTLEKVDFLKFYSGSIYKFGHPFTFRNKVLRMLSWEDETYRFCR